MGLAIIVLGVTLLKAKETTVIAIKGGVAVCLPEMSLTELQQHDGVTKETTYMAVNGTVYDVTSEKNFYEAGGPYHYLVAKDATEDLAPVGTGIITNKYPAVARLVP